MEFDLEEFNRSFNEATKFHQHKIVCGDRTFFVHGCFLGEQSRYFEKLFYGDFKEADTKVITISPASNISAEDVLEYLSVLYGRKEVTEANCACIFRMGDVWDTPSIRAKSAKFLESGYWPSLRSDGSQLKAAIDVLETALLHGLRKSVTNLVQFIGRHLPDLLKAERFIDKVDDKRVLAVVFILSGRCTCSTHKSISINGNCHDCGSVAYYACSCGKRYCGTHRNNPNDSYCSFNSYPIDNSFLFEEEEEEK